MKTTRRQFLQKSAGTAGALAVSRNILIEPEQRFEQMRADESRAARHQPSPALSADGLRARQCSA